MIVEDINKVILFRYCQCNFLHISSYIFGGSHQKL